MKTSNKPQPENTCSHEFIKTHVAQKPGRDQKDKKTILHLLHI